ncbi:homeobox protein ATH1 [Nicotiana tomentosiformis]|uniref:homeobox protein ATH1 n=1 Tax=Nicotiana tomentosiformis TaxID=4098 RepID=UPI0007B9ADAC|nr:PREDICTED: homeobox protein ATH1-like [Nicotiana tabacum]XP_033509608.1 homeobox protein ATH1 [Nicotiana tomentosiformis]
MAEPHTIIDENFLHTASIPISFPDRVGLNNQNHVMDGQNHIMDGHEIPIPFMLQGEAINSSQDFLSLPNFPRAVDTGAIHSVLPMRNRIKEFSLSTSYPINNAYTEDQYMEGIPISAVSLANLLATRNAMPENHENLAALASLSHPVEGHKTDVLDYPTMLNHSFGSYRNYEFDGVPEIAGTIVGRTGSQPFQLSHENVNSNTWFSSETASMNSDSPSGSSSRFSNELSLSLTSTQSGVACGTTIRDQCSDISCSGVTNHAFPQRRFDSELTSCNSRNLSLNFGSYKPVHLSQFLTGSRYLRVMQEILSEMAHLSLQNHNLVGYRGNGAEYGANTSFTLSSDDLPDEDRRIIGQMNSEAKKKHLVALLQVVDDQYNQCLDEIHMVISAFHAVTELNPSIHARFALQTISSLYKNLRERISNYILAMGEHFNRGGERGVEKSFETSFIQKQWALQQLKRKDHQLWRPQRGLPERSVSVLRAWMFQNFLHPYPKDAEKQLLAVKSGLTRSQVSNWFINARVRLWKPMIEEMYAEMNRRKIRTGNHEDETNNRRNHKIDNRLFTMK